MLNNFQRVEVLSNFLPFLQSWHGRIIVVKYGGSVMQNLSLKSKIVQDILLLSYLGIKVIIVHGGGPIINNWLSKLGIKPQFFNGVRMTDKNTMELVEMVLVGKVNKDLVTLLNNSSSTAVGLSGKDANLIIASPLFPQQPDNYTGKIEKINLKVVDLLLHSGYIPVIASVASDKNGQAYNINADSVAGAIAESLNADKLILLTDMPGIMSDTNNPASLFKNLDVQQLENLKDKKIILGGMIPKVDCCIKALKNNVRSVHIVNGSIEHVLLLEILTSSSTGSILLP
uniref:Acetylglutamate kinase n=1 Tax=Gracilaria edulis TaxID=172966 RepID=A0A6C0A9B6_9FLOR|nr:acetylglutamate kinase [Gracilaria edulis]QHS70495.1 acetylglutamate kinase [Gracilaria edulis]